MVVSFLVDGCSLSDQPKYAEEDQVSGDNVVQQAGHDQDQYPGDKRQ
jgi:hypothetical protein